MIEKSLDLMKREMAKFARNVEYIRETASDDMLDARLERVESEYVRESVDELEEAAEMVNKLSGEEDFAVESAEIDKLVNATANISFNEMIGV